MINIPDHRPEDRFYVKQSDMSLAPGDSFATGPIEWIAVTYPYGATTELAPGIRIPIGMIADPEGNPEPGDIIAVKREARNV